MSTFVLLYLVIISNANYFIVLYNLYLNKSTIIYY